MVSSIIRQVGKRYAANYDKKGKFWRIIDLSHEDISGMDFESDIPDSHPAVTILPEMAFIALVDEARALGFIKTTVLGNVPQVDGDAEILDSGAALRDLEVVAKQRDELKLRLSEVERELERVKNTPKSESFLLKEKVIEANLRLAGMLDIQDFGKK